MRKAVEPQGEAKPDWWIIGQIALRMGMSGLDYDSPVPIFNELCELSPIYSGIDWELADGGQYQWPIPYRGHPGTPRLHEDEFENGRGKFSFTDYRDPAETIDEELSSVAHNRAAAGELSYAHADGKVGGHQRPAAGGRRWRCIRAMSHATVCTTAAGQR